MPVGQAARASDACEVIHSERALVADDESLQLFASMGEEVMTADTALSILCFNFSGNNSETVVERPDVGKRPYKGTTVIPPQICADGSNETLPLQQVAVHY